MAFSVSAPRTDPPRQVHGRATPLHRGPGAPRSTARPGPSARLFARGLGSTVRRVRSTCGVPAGRRQHLLRTRRARAPAQPRGPCPLVARLGRNRGTLRYQPFAERVVGGGFRASKSASPADSACRSPAPRGAAPARDRGVGVPPAGARRAGAFRTHSIDGAPCAVNAAPGSARVMAPRPGPLRRSFRSQRLDVVLGAREVALRRPHDAPRGPMRCTGRCVATPGSSPALHLRGVRPSR